MANKKSASEMLNKMELVEIRYLLDLLEGEPVLKMQLLVDDATTEEKMWEIIRERDEEFAHALESGWDDRSKIILVDSEEEKKEKEDDGIEDFEYQINPRDELLDELYEDLQEDIEESGIQSNHLEIVESLQSNVPSKYLGERWEKLIR